MYKEAPDRMYMVFRHLNSEVEYIRADLHQAEVDALHAECDRLTALVGRDHHCLWYADEGDDTWLTGCGNAYGYDRSSSDVFRFCPYCGGEIRMGEGE